jgi:hypothetical protein
MCTNIVSTVTKGKLVGEAQGCGFYILLLIGRVEVEIDAAFKN